MSTKLVQFRPPSQKWVERLDKEAERRGLNRSQFIRMVVEKEINVGEESK